MKLKELFPAFSLFSLLAGLALSPLVAFSESEKTLADILNNLESEKLSILQYENSYRNSLADLSNLSFQTSDLNKAQDLSHSIVISKDQITNKNHLKILAAIGATGIMIAFDEQIMDFVQDHPTDTTEKLADFGDHMGSDYLAPLVVGTYALGLVLKDKKMKEVAVEAVESALLGQIVIEAMKSLTHRARPNDDRGAYAFDGPGWTSGNTSFASGHSAGAWSVATIYAKKYSDSKLIPFLAYGIATITSLSRVHDNKHWASDVFMGAAVGYASANIVYNYNKNRRLRNLVVVPDVRKDYAGVALQIKFNARKKQ